MCRWCFQASLLESTVHYFTKKHTYYKGIKSSEFDFGRYFLVAENAFERFMNIDSNIFLLLMSFSVPSRLPINLHSFHASPPFCSMIYSSVFDSFICSFIVFKLTRNSFFNMIYSMFGS